MLREFKKDEFRMMGSIFAKRVVENIVTHLLILKEIMKLKEELIRE